MKMRMRKNLLCTEVENRIHETLVPYYLGFGSDFTSFVVFFLNRSQVNGSKLGCFKTAFFCTLVLEHSTSQLNI